MKQQIPDADAYFDIGCGRCSLAATPACKVKHFPEELTLLRQMLLDTELNETLKWSVPCYTINGKNILILSAFKNYCSLNFFRGSLLSDPDGLLVKAGENSQEGRQMRFQNVQEIYHQQNQIRNFIRQAILLENSGKPIPKTPAPVMRLPDELADALNTDSELNRAFYALTPGRQRSYILHITGAKQSSTRSSRILQCRAAILEGRGFHEYPAEKRQKN